MDILYFVKPDRHRFLKAVEDYLSTFEMYRPQTLQGYRAKRQFPW